MLEKGCAYCSYFKSVESGVFASRFAWIMCLRGFVFHGMICSSDFLFWKFFLLDFMWVSFLLHESKMFALEPYVSLIYLHASEGFSGGQIVGGLFFFEWVKSCTEFIKSKFYVDIKLSWLHMFVFSQVFKTTGVVYARAFSFLGLVQIDCFQIEPDFNFLTYNELSKIFCVCQKSYLECCIVFGQKILLFSLSYPRTFIIHYQVNNGKSKCFAMRLLA